MTQQADYAVPGQLTEVDRLLAEHPMGDAVVDEVEGRMVRIGGRWLADFASCNHLGLDLDPAVLAASPSTWPAGRPTTSSRRSPSYVFSGPVPGPARPPRQAGGATTNTSGFPLVELALADADDLDAVGRHLFDRGVYVTLAPYPVVPRREAGVRIQLTAANTSEQVDHPLAVLAEVDDRFGFRRPHP